MDEYITPELFLLLMTLLFTFYRCLLSAIIFVVFVLLAGTLHLPFLTSYLTLPYLTLPYLLPYILPCLTLSYVLP